MSNRGRYDIPLIVIFTDLDGTLLDHETYGWKEAEPALDACRSRGIPICMVSSKTRAEMEILRVHLGISAPFVSENGGGIFFPQQALQEPPQEAVLINGLYVWALGPPHSVLVEAFEAIRKELGWRMKGLSEMSIEEISELTGLDHETCRLAAQREYDEPFVLEASHEGSPSLLERAAETRGLRVSVGGRFFHLHGKNDKAEAVRNLISWYKEKSARLVTVGLGDSPNDFSMLKETTHPVLIRSDRRFPGLERTIPGLRITAQSGPRAWNRAVLELIQEIEGGFP